MARWQPIAALLLALTPGVARPQELTLAEVLRRAGAEAYPVRAAAAGRSIRQAEALKPLRGILPAFRVEGGWLRSNEPLGAFGVSLRQRELTAASFDPAALNYPDAVDTWSSGAVLEVPLVNLDAWTGRRSASLAVASARSSERWVRTGAQVEAVRAYLGAVLAGNQVTTLEAGLQAANAHVREAERLLDQGMVTRSDVLLARVRRDQLEVDLLAAAAEQRLAGRRLSMAMGSPEPVSTLPCALPSPDSVAAFLEAVPSGSSTAGRADLAAARLGAEAARADQRRATTTLLPRVNGFARWDWYAGAGPWRGDAGYTVGVQAQWWPFSGASELAEIRSARGRADEAAALAAGAEARAELELRERETAMDVALARLRQARSAVDQSAEAHRLVSRRYAGGLAGVVELLDAQAAETAARLGLSRSTYEALMAVAERQRAVGADVAVITGIVP